MPGSDMGRSRDRHTFNSVRNRQTCSAVSFEIGMQASGGKGGWATVVLPVSRAATSPRGPARRGWLFPNRSPRLAVQLRSAAGHRPAPGAPAPGAPQSVLSIFTSPRRFPQIQTLSPRSRQEGENKAKGTRGGRVCPFSLRKQ